MRNMFYSITLLQYSSLILRNCFVWIKWPITVAHGTLQASYEAGLKCLLTVSIISLFLIFLSTWPMVWVKRHLLHIYLSIYLYLAYKQLVTPTLIVMLQMRQPAGEANCSQGAYLLLISSSAREMFEVSHEQKGAIFWSCLNLKCLLHGGWNYWSVRHSFSWYKAVYNAWNENLSGKYTRLHRRRNNNH